MRYILILILSVAAFGQQVQGPRVLTAATFASPPSSPATGAVYVFTDASAVGTCSGGGSALATCRYSGSAWQATGGGSGSGGCTVVAANGDWLIPGGAFSIGAYGGASGIIHMNPNASSANTTVAVRVYIPCAFTPNKIGFQLSTPGTTGCKMEIGIFDQAGTTLLIHSGVITDGTTVACNGSAGQRYTTSGTSPAATGLGTLYAAGWYWVAVTTNETTARITGMPAPASAGEPGLLITGGPATAVMGTSGTGTTNGALNSSLGTISSAASAVPMVILSFN
jgi:hypothetical protein